MPPNNENPYEILGLANDATEQDAKKAYRKLALKYHPDRQTGSEEEKEKASAMFIKISEAHDTLTDPVKRYDLRMKEEAEAKKSSPATNRRPQHAPQGATRRHSPNRTSVRKRAGTSPRAEANKPPAASNRRSQHAPQAAARRSPNRPRYPDQPRSFRHLQRGKSDDGAPTKRANSVGPLATRSGYAPRGTHAHLQRGRSDDGAPIQRASSVGHLATRSGHAPRGTYAPRVSQNKSKASSILRGGGDNVVMSKKKEKKKTVESVHHPENTFSFVRNNGKKKMSPEKAPADNASVKEKKEIKKKKKKKKKKKPEAENIPHPETNMRQDKNSAMLNDSNRREKKEGSHAASIKWTRNIGKNNKTGTVDRSRRNSNNSADDGNRRQRKGDKKKTMSKQHQTPPSKLNGLSKPKSSNSIFGKASSFMSPSSSRNLAKHGSPQSTNRKSIMNLGYGRSNTNASSQKHLSPKSTKNTKKKAVGIKSFLGLPTMETKG